MQHLHGSLRAPAMDLHQVSCGGIAAQRFEESLHANRPF